MGDLRRGGAVLLTIVLSMCVSQCGTGAPPPDPFSALPGLEREVTLVAEGDTLHPVRLQIHDGHLWVSYRRQARIDVYSLDVQRVESIRLEVPEPVLPSAFVVTDSLLIVADHSKGMVLAYDAQGALLESFGRMPDQETGLSPLSVTYYGGVAYVADMSQRRILAVSMADAPGITEPGELILTIPRESEPSLGLPSAVHVTEDGRLLAGDATAGQVRVFTCDGRSVYRFDAVPGVQTIAPQGFALDDVVDPELQDPSVFDPSGVRQMGRVHVVDGLHGVVRVYNPLGKYVLTYPAGPRLAAPSGIAIDPSSNRIFVADAPTGRILVYRYEDGRDV